ncbi:hypothetical protein HHL24_06480 [Paraburkholderia sp. RP-4-7]|uniref:NAD-dependent epimerase/dehydratase family protein n=1 Tax=Paraburkholderia polaris TaxID=2728848 RepID=A0A848IDH5_9BURK|nr:hypothetical protein [Paraburkholderia polaris]NML97596.1 hypothetical protein [Paraburkholderia polaris]
MRIVLIGATGMVGQGVLHACLDARDVTEIIVVGRRAPHDYEDPQINIVITAVRRIWPSSVLTTRIIGDAMLNVVHRGMPPRAILRPTDIYRLSSSYS